MACSDKHPPPLTTNPKEHVSTAHHLPQYYTLAWHRNSLLGRVALVVVATTVVYGLSAVFRYPSSRLLAQSTTQYSEDILNRCANRHAAPGSPADDFIRHVSDRFEPGTRPTLIKNVTLWTGARNGTEVVYGDILLDKGLVQGIGYIPEWDYSSYDTDVVDAHGGWVTPGLGTPLRIRTRVETNIMALQWTCIRA